MTPLFLIGALYAAYLIYIIVSLIITMVRGEKTSRNSFTAAVILLSEIIYTIIGPALGFSRYDQYGPEIPFAKHHIFIIILLVISSSASFWLARLTSGTKNPVVRIILSAGMLQGIILCFIVSIHFVAFMAMGLIFPWAGFELLSPVVAFVILLREFYFYNKVQLNINEIIPYHSDLGFEPAPYKIFSQPIILRILVYLVMVIVFVIVQMLLCYAIGLDMDSIIKAFTKSVGFMFSQRN